MRLNARGISILNYTHINNSCIGVPYIELLSYMLEVALGINLKWLTNVALPHQVDRGVLGRVKCFREPWKAKSMG